MRASAASYSSHSSEVTPLRRLPRSVLPVSMLPVSVLPVSVPRAPPRPAHAVYYDMGAAVLCVPANVCVHQRVCVPVYQRVRRLLCVCTEECVPA